MNTLSSSLFKNTLLLLALTSCSFDSSNSVATDSGQGDVDADARGLGDSDAAQPADAGSDDAGADAAQPVVPRILILDDGDSNATPALQIATYLEGAGFDATIGPHYEDYLDGDDDELDPVASDFAVIIWLEGTDFGEDISEAMDTSLVNFVNNGGTLARTEWAGWSIGPDASDDDLIDQLMPVITPNQAFAFGTTWNVVDNMHPLTTGLSPVADIDGAGFTTVTANAQATVVVESNNGIPLVSVQDFGLGKVVHINHDITYSVETVHSEVLQVFANLPAL